MLILLIAIVSTLVALVAGIRAFVRFLEMTDE